MVYLELGGLDLVGQQQLRLGHMPGALQPVELSRCWLCMMKPSSAAAHLCYVLLDSIVLANQAHSASPQSVDWMGVLDEEWWNLRVLRSSGNAVTAHVAEAIMQSMTSDSWHPFSRSTCTALGCHGHWWGDWAPEGFCSKCPRAHQESLLQLSFEACGNQ